MRRLIVMLAFVAGCAASTAAPDAGGQDLSVGQCDQKQLFPQCSAQCNFKVCIIGGSVSCDIDTWMCDCSQAIPCAAGDGGSKHD